ncbi:MAG: GGDEF domain-containing protein [Terriglobia bacterium]|jgi:diguanylate cyclase (GGDEF)-like protein
MSNQSEVVEQVGPQARIQAELVKLESQKREFWVLVVFAGLVLLLGILSFFFPSAFWRSNSLHVSLSPQILFVLMVATVLIALFYVRRDLDIKGLRLSNLQRLLSSQEDQAASMIDAVTNVFTRSFLHDLLQGEIARAERTNRPLALLMCDLNDFKQVNDRYGHLMGDYVLSQVAAILKAAVRGCDYVVRYGGDEFLIVLPETDEQGGETVRQRIHRRVAEWDQNNRVGDLPLAISQGLYLHVTGQTPEKDVAEADARMYADKQASKQAPTLPYPTTFPP